jgi:group I intron endonuclease
LLKNGYSNFSLEILEYCEPSEAVVREQYYLDLLHPQYNILKFSGSLRGFKHSEETKAKLSAAIQGRTHTEETIAKM